MFASLISRLPSPLRRALAHAKAFAFLEDPPPALPRRHPERFRPLADTTTPDATAPCPADRRRRAPGARPAVTLTPKLHACGKASARHARRSGAVARPNQLCRTPTNGRPVTTPSTAREDRRAAVAGAFLHR